MLVVSGPNLDRRLDSLRRFALTVRAAVFALVAATAVVVLIAGYPVSGGSMLGASLLALTPFLWRHHSLEERFDRVVITDVAVFGIWAALIPPAALIPVVGFYLVVLGSLLCSRRIVPLVAGLAGLAMVANLAVPGFEGLDPLRAAANRAVEVGGFTVSVDLVITLVMLVAAGLVLLQVRHGLESAADEAGSEQQRLEQVLEAAPAEVAIVDSSDLTVRFINRRWAEVLGIDASGARGGSVLDYVEAADREQVESTLRRIAGGEVVREDRIRVSAEGGERTYSYVGVPVVYEGQAAVMTLAQDVTDQVRAEDEAEERRRELAALFDRLPVALYRSSPDGEVLEANTALEDLLGYSREELQVGSVDRFYVDPAAPRAWRRQIEAEGVTLGFEQQLIRKDGSRIWVEDSARAVRNDDGELLYYEGALIDVTARKQAEASRSRLLSILDAAVDVVMVFDLDGYCFYANRAARRFYGEDHELVGRHGDDLLPHIEDAARIRRGLAEHGVWEGEVEAMRHDGELVPSSLILQQHESPSGKPRYVSMIARDISELRAVHDRLQQALRSKDEFVATVSHEIRTPLTAVVGLAEELRSAIDMLDTDTTREIATMIAQQGHEMADIVEDLLVAARAEIGTIAINPQVFELGSEVRGVVASLDGMGGEQVSVSGDDPRAWADPQRVRQVVRNLVTNAVRYGGDQVRVRVDGSASQPAVEVLDDGDGIPEESRERIFEAFGRAHDDAHTNSVGLGLAVSRQLALLMDGDLTYDHRDGWSVFRLTLPAPPPEVDHPTTELETADA